MPLHPTVTLTKGRLGCPGGLVAVISVEDRIVAAWAGALPKNTFAPAPKPVPEMVTVSPPPSDPWPGETPVTVGSAHDDGVGEATLACGAGGDVVAGGRLAVSATGAHGGEAGSPTSPCAGQAVDVPPLRTGLGRLDCGRPGFGIHPGALPTGLTWLETAGEVTMTADVRLCGAGPADLTKRWLVSNAVGMVAMPITGAASTKISVTK